MVEINLMEKYPKTKRNVDERGTKKTDEDRRIAREFEEAFFDGDRSHGYGGFNYNPKFWTDVVQDFIKFYDLDENSSLLDVGCAKGFMMHDFKLALPKMLVKGIDISKYAIKNAIDDMKPFVMVGDAKDLSMFKNDEFDLIISINTVHNLPLEECKQSIKEIQRVSKKAFLTVDAWTNDEEKQRMINWNLTAKTFMHVDDWKKLFEEVGYTGDYFWFIP
jgi:SAM-dependent methyltransferase